MQELGMMRGMRSPFYFAFGAVVANAFLLIRLSTHRSCNESGQDHLRSHYAHGDRRCHLGSHKAQAPQSQTDRQRQALSDDSKHHHVCCFIDQKSGSSCSSPIDAIDVSRSMICWLRGHAFDTLSMCCVAFSRRSMTCLKSFASQCTRMLL